MSTTAIADTAEPNDLGLVLRERYDAVLAAWNRQVETVRGMRRAAGDASVDDLGDSGTKVAEYEQEESLAHSLGQQLEQISAAIGRWEAGGYGSCDSCRQAIPVERLLAFPAATMCVACKSSRERRAR